MPLRAGRRIVGAVLVLLLLAVTLLPARRAAAQLPWRDKGTPFGMVTAMANRVRTDETDTYVQMLREAGVQWTREEFFWHKIQPQPDSPYQWNGDGSGLYDYDRAVGAQAGPGDGRSDGGGGLVLRHVARLDAGHHDLLDAGGGERGDLLRTDQRAFLEH